MEVNAYHLHCGNWLTFLKVILHWTQVSYTATMVYIICLQWCKVQVPKYKCVIWPDLKKRALVKSRNSELPVGSCNLAGK